MSNDTLKESEVWDREGSGIRFGGGKLDEGLRHVRNDFASALLGVPDNSPWRTGRKRDFGPGDGRLTDG